ncbi:MAG: hypothetical protein IKR85_10040 [Clostridia bacterium]|nr:hypothetical protein [Clostridia bacterium]
MAGKLPLARGTNARWLLVLALPDADVQPCAFRTCEIYAGSFREETNLGGESETLSPRAYPVFRVKRTGLSGAPEMRVYVEKALMNGSWSCLTDAFDAYVICREPSDAGAGRPEYYAVRYTRCALVPADAKTLELRAHSPGVRGYVYGLTRAVFDNIQDEFEKE